MMQKREERKRRERRGKKDTQPSFVMCVPIFITRQQSKSRLASSLIMLLWYYSVRVLHSLEQYMWPFRVIMIHVLLTLVTIVM